jgi:hypothetical protein
MRSIQRLITDQLIALGLLAPIGVLSGSEVEIASRMLAALQPLRPGERGFLERHIIQIVRALRANHEQVIVSNLAARFCPEALLDLSYDLEREAGVALRSYLADLPDGIAPVFTQAKDILALMLSSPARASLIKISKRLRSIEIRSTVSRLHAVLWLSWPRPGALSVHRALGFALLSDGEVSANELSLMHRVDSQEALRVLSWAVEARLLLAPITAADPCSASYLLTRRGAKKVIRNFSWRISPIGILIDELRRPMRALMVRVQRPKTVDPARELLREELLDGLLRRQPERFATGVIDERSTVDCGDRLSRRSGRVSLELGRQSLADPTRVGHD